MPVQFYGLALGWGVALASIPYLENILGTRPLTVVNSQPVNRFPVRDVTLSGREAAQGRINHVLVMPVLPKARLITYENVYFSSGTLVSVQATLLTNVHDRGEFRRYNCWAHLPKPTQPDSPGDYTLDRGYARDLNLRFSNLVQL